MKNVLIAMLLYSGLTLTCQEDNRGIILDSVTKEPLRYAALSWNSSQGAIANEEGRYELFLNSSDSVHITISHIGYKELRLNSMALSDTIYLSPKAYELDEIVLIDTDDLKNKILSSLNKNYDSNPDCDAFFYKQFLRENGAYVNYLEATGLVTYLSSVETPEVFIKGLRKTDNLITSYINMRSGGIIGLLRATAADLLKAGSIVDYNWITSDLIEAIVEDENTKTLSTLTINIYDYAIIKVLQNSLTDGLEHKYNNQTIRIDGKKIEFNGYLQGAFLEYDYRKIGGKYYLNRIYQKGKGILVSTDGSMKHQFVSEQLYLTTKTLLNCPEKVQMIRLKKGKSLRKLKVKYHTEDWARLNGILPLKEQQQILSTLGKLK
ncbi:MAG: carboxypeptidase-like regulatory domain-containing protein [Maribacter sp.]|uniref:carboxypeptidase-like regulatory domain-containing protein n=1 Tax=Maribacter sp. TaxID=1897614 RepID=UPI00329771E6